MRISSKAYFRIQPRGLGLRGHTSEGSATPLPRGYVFAYHWRNPSEACEWFAPLEDDEVVVFEGSGEYDPGDAEGVAVKPGRIIARMTVAEWLRRARRIDPFGAGWYSERIDELRGC